MARKLRILLTGGGTGGHIYPIIAVAQKLRGWAEKNGIEPDLRYYGQPGEYRAVLESAGIRISKITSSKLRRYFSPTNFWDFFRFIFGFCQSLFKMYWFMPEVIFSKGGPGALSVVFASKFYLIPLVVHESDAIPGLTNKISARRAKFVDVAFSLAEKYLKTKGEMHVAGNPVREELLVQVPQGQAKTEFGFDPKKPLILFLGGSQGSASMNDFVLANLESVLQNYQVLHQIGKEKYAEYKLQYEFTSKNFSPILAANYKYFDYLDKDLGRAMDASDIIVSRAGSGAIFEIAAKGRPAILIPFPNAAANHQKENAYQYAETGAAAVIEEENLLPSILLSQLEKILNNSDIKTKMSAAAKDFYKPSAAEQIATDILKLWTD